MPKHLTTKSPASTLAKYKKLLGPALVLSSESHKDYDAIMARFTECLEPQNFIELMFVNDLTVATWEIRRYSLHMIYLIERQHVRHQAIEEKRRQQEQKRKEDIAYWDERRQKAKQNAEESGQTKPETTEQGEQIEQVDAPDQAGAPTTLFKRMLDLEEIVDSTVSDVDEILEAPADEEDHAEALEAVMDSYEQYYRLRSVAIAWRNDVLRQLEFYRQGLGQHLRRVSDAIIDGEFSETEHEAPSLAGPDGDEQ
jgi:hypothetical protein